MIRDVCLSSRAKNITAILITKLAATKKEYNKKDVCNIEIWVICASTFNLSTNIVTENQKTLFTLYKAC